MTDKIADALGLFASCIKSGEPWTTYCETAKQEAFAALTALRQDAERLDWLEHNPGVIHPENAVYKGWNAEGFHDEEEGWANSETHTWYPSLRAAIDAARHPETGSGT